MRSESNEETRRAESDAPASPETEMELMARARSIAGRNLQAVAKSLGLPVPTESKRAKGWAGQLLEQALGATARSRAEPDFPGLGIELKSLPVTLTGRPLETTFVCTIDLLDIGRVEWRDSRVYTKLRRVLWIPIEGERALPLGVRRIGHPLLWSPSEQQERALRQDWEELAGLIGCGKLDEITAHLGQYLQVRPKAANAQARRRAEHPDGGYASVLPKGFYLRTTFTRALLQAHFGLHAGQHD